MSRQFSVIGVDISTPMVRAVQLVREGHAAPRRFATAAFPILRRPNARPEDEFDRLAGALLRRAFVGSEIALCLPDDRLLTAVLQLPPASSGAPLPQLAAAELSRLFKREPGSLETTIWDLPAAARQLNGSCQCLTLSAGHDHTEPLIEAAASAGLTVRSIEPRPAVLARAAQLLVNRGATHATNTSRATVIVNIGHTTGQITVARGARLLHQTPMDGCGTISVSLPVAEALHIDPLLVEAAMRATIAGSQPGNAPSADRRVIDSVLEQHAARVAICIRSSFDYIGHRFAAIERGDLVLTGDLHMVPDLARRLAPRVGADAHLLTIAGPHPAGTPEQTAPFATALGAALQSFAGTSQRHTATGERATAGASA